ncbi:MAG: SH3 domain-containing protein [Chloroflexi bacterium]|nr:MAG: SH3 domain-containing protein [Chloroflexota bacterium]
MLRRLFILTVCLIMMLTALPAYGQQARWLVWLYDPDGGRMTQVDSNGMVLQQFRLPTPISRDARYPFHVAVSPGGTRIAYIMVNTATFTQELLVWDTVLERLVAQFTPPQALSNSLMFTATPRIYNDAGTEIAFGFSRVEGGWQLVVFNLISATPAFILQDNAPQVRALGIEVGFDIVPVVQAYDGTTVIFTMVQGGTEGSPAYPSYRWNVHTGAVSPDVAYPTLNNDAFPPTGEVIMAMQDLRLPNRNSEFIFFQTNALHVYDSGSDVRFPVYNNPDFALFFPHFIQNGERILVSGRGVRNDTIQHFVLDRAGNLVGFLPLGDISAAAGVGDGFIYLQDPPTLGSVSTLMHVNTRDGIDAGDVVWTSEPDVLLQIAWVNDPANIGGAAYPAWPVLEAETSPLLPGDSGGGDPLAIVVGGQAIINTTGGDALNVRSGPSTVFQVVGQLADNTRVIVLEGPQEGAGFTWWRVSGPDGITGWVVASADGVQTLLPG